MIYAAGQQCPLCDHPARITDTDRGNRSYVACANAKCGDYEISKRAMRELSDNPERKRTLQDQVVRANVEGHVLEIIVGPGGKLQASSARRG